MTPLGLFCLEGRSSVINLIILFLLSPPPSLKYLHTSQENPLSKPLWATDWWVSCPLHFTTSPSLKTHLLKKQKKTILDGSTSRFFKIQKNKKTLTTAAASAHSLQTCWWLNTAGPSMCPSFSQRSHVSLPLPHESGRRSNCRLKGFVSNSCSAKGNHS